MELTRKQVINTLNTLKLEWGELAPPEDNICDALEYAISSLKTDEAYQIMYEGGEIFTKADMVAMLKELKSEIDIMSDTVVEERTITITSWSGMKKRICELIQSKIDKYKAESEPQESEDNK